MPPSNEPAQLSNTPTNPVAPTPEQPTHPSTPGKSKWPLIVAVMAVVLVAAALAAYFLVIKKPADQSPSSNSSSQSSTSNQEVLTTTSITTTNSPNGKNGTVSFTHPASWQVVKETDQYGTENTTIKSALNNAVQMYRRDSVGGSCEDDSNTYTLVKKIPTQSSAYVFSEYQVPASWGSQALSLEVSYDGQTAAHKALAEGQSNTNLCKNLAGYSIAKDINVTIKNSSSKEATYNDIKDDAAFITMLQSFKVTDN